MLFNFFLLLYDFYFSFKIIFNVDARKTPEIFNFKPFLWMIQNITNQQFIFLTIDKEFFKIYFPNHNDHMYTNYTRIDCGENVQN